MRRAGYISFAIGCIVATALAVGWRFYWHLVNAGTISLTPSSYYGFSDISNYLCPSSLLLMDVGPREPLGIVLVISYVIVILLNGLLYALVVVAFGKLAKVFGKLGVNRVM
jgi:hypothetical protein